MSTRTEKIGIVGSGLIGRSWAMLYAGVGYKVKIYDIEPKQIETALTDIKQQLETLEKNNLLRGKLTAAQQIACITGTTSLEEAVKDAVLVQECVPENIELKRKVWSEIDAVATPNTVLASSTSTYIPSLFSDHLKNKKNIIVAHPVNPPYYVPLIELVPAPWTDPKIAQKAKELMEEIGQTPILMSKEIPGFLINRLQYALLNEAWNLVSEGIVSVSDVDKVMSDGLGMRYAFLGMFETAHLNAEGFVNYCDRYSKIIVSTTQDFRPPPNWQGPMVKEIARQLEQNIPIEKLQEKRNWRDLCLTKLSQLKKEMKED